MFHSRFVVITLITGSKWNLSDQKPNDIATPVRSSHIHRAETPQAWPESKFSIACGFRPSFMSNVLKFLESLTVAPNGNVKPSSHSL